MATGLEKIVADFGVFFYSEMDYSETTDEKLVEGGIRTRQLDGQEKANQDSSNRLKLRNEINRIIKENPDNGDEIKTTLLNTLPRELKDRIFN